MIRAALKQWHDAAVEIRKARWEWASQVLQRRTRGILVRRALAYDKPQNVVVASNGGLFGGVTHAN